MERLRSLSRERRCGPAGQPPGGSRLDAAKDFAAPAVRAGFLEFPESFVFGTATAAYQIEGAASEGGRKPSIWDKFSHTEGKTANGATGDAACDHYHRFRTDVAIMARLGLGAYRFSISWSRLLPDGDDKVNPEGVKFYSDLIDELLANGIAPWVTLYHWDLPQSLQEEFQGWLGPKDRIVGAFAVYARICFSLFGDRVKRWITLNETWSYAIMGYQFGCHPPGHKKGQVEQYIVGHNSLLAHAEAARIYHEDFGPRQGGLLGISLCINWMQPLTQEAPEHAEAAQRRLSFMLGWFADPIFLGDYPAVMRETCGDRLPSFTEEERKLLRGSSDFFGLNSYSTGLCVSCLEHQDYIREHIGGFAADVSVAVKEDPAWERTDCHWPIVPWGLREVLLYIQRRYAPPAGIFITECGCALEPEAVHEQDKLGESLVPKPYNVEASEPEDFENETLDDPKRVRFLQAHLSAVHAALEQGADVRGIFVWSLLDNFEWAEGYRLRFGIVRVDYPSQKRTIKASGRFYAEVARRRGLDAPPRSEQYAGEPF